MTEGLFLGFINENQLIEPGGRTLLAVSGGLDSMVMTHLFYRTGQPFAIAHVNFGLRGPESDADAAFIKNTASGYGVPFHQVCFNTAEVARERSISIQMAARDLRYDWFEQLLDQYGYAAVATAHHLNDVLETILLNLTRGTGLAGLHGIASRHKRVIRPLLFATRDDLRTYAREQQLSYREDSSNADDKYARNRIRHHVVPVLTDLNPGLWQTLPHTVDRLATAERLMQAELDRSWGETHELQDDRIWLPTAKLRALPDLAFRLMHWLKPYGFTPEQSRLMTDALNRPVGQIFTSATHQITHDRTTTMTGLLLEPLPMPAPPDLLLAEWPDAPVRVGEQFYLHIDRYDRPADFRFPTDSEQVYFDANRLRLPLLIRRWQLGDRFHPLGMKGRKLVSNLLNEQKLSRSERERTTVLLSGGEIAWVIGSRLAHSFRVIDTTTRLVCIWRSKTNG